MTDAERKTLQQAIRDAWLAAVGAVSTSAEGAEARARAQIERLLEAAGEKRTALGAELGEMVTRVRKNGEALERRVDDGVKAAVARVRAPIDEKVAHLSERVTALGERVEARRKKKRDGTP